jgi:hypothetical protein
MYKIIPLYAILLNNLAYSKFKLNENEGNLFKALHQG